MGDIYYFDNEEDLRAWLDENAVVVDQLTPEEQARYREFQAVIEEFCEQHGRPAPVDSLGDLFGT